jgi:uncharacterized protein (TIGR02145 family)
MEKTHHYDVALSFAGEDRNYVEQVAFVLRSNNIKVFYDGFEEVNLWGKNLYSHLSSVYNEKAKFTVLFISKYYSQKLWTNHERENAQARAFTENTEYILPARFDDTKIPGLLTTVGYIDLKKCSPEKFAMLIIEKINSQSAITTENLESKTNYHTADQNIFVEESKHRRLNKKYIYSIIGAFILIGVLFFYYIKLKNPESIKGKDIVQSLNADSLKLVSKKLNETNLPKQIPSVMISRQEWSAKNFDEINYRNGDTISHAKSIEEWKKYSKQGIGCWAYYDNSVKNGEIFGKIYNYYAIIDERGIEPYGWHLPSEADFDTLTGLVDYTSTATIYKSKNLWKYFPGSNKTQLSLLPGGEMDGFNEYNGLYELSSWWLKQPKDKSEIITFGIDNSRADIVVVGIGSRDNYITISRTSGEGPAFNGSYIRLVRNK